MDAYGFTQKLPESDRVEAGYLESMLNNFSSSYKLFWFKGILTEITDGNLQIEYKKIVAHMIASAWYPVVFYKLSLGFSDKLAEAVWYIHDTLGVKRDESEEKLISYIYNSTDRELQRKIKDLTNMVPFRLIRPFYQREIELEKKKDHSFSDGKVNRIIEECNKHDLGHAFYIMDRLNGTLTVSKAWEEYIRRNAPVVLGWLNYKIIEYIQLRNPNVPAIPFKIFPPKQRNLSEATSYWELVGQRENFPDLYTGRDFTEENKERYGAVSIDHFIPWSFVLHDELWNLYPSFKNINSKKGNKLPALEKYLNNFCEYQYRAFLIAKGIPKIKKKTIEQYLTINRDIFQIGKDDRGHSVFVNAMRQTIQPLYQIADNQGYGVWWYE